MKKSLCATLALLIALMCLLSIPSIGKSQTLAANADSGTKLKVDFTQLWENKLERSYVASPVYADGFLYAVCANSGSGTGTLYCINASSGNQVWNSTGVFYAYAVASGRVYVGSSVWGASTSWTMQGVVSCLNAYDGTQIWNYSHGTGFSTPVASGNVVYVPGFNYSMSTGINTGFIYAFNALTGAEIWSWASPTNTRFDYAPLWLADRKLYALSAAYSERDPSWHSGVYAFDAETGNPLWNYTTPGQFSSLAVTDQAVYVSSNFVNTTDYTDAQYSGGYVYDGGILALDASSGSKMWEYPIQSFVEPPILGDSMIYAVSEDGMVCALNKVDGAEIWRRATQTKLGHGLLADGFLYVGSSEGVYCFNPLNGKVVWNFKTYDACDSAPTFPVYADGVVYVGLNGPQFFSSVIREGFYALDPFTGERIGNCTLGYTIKSLPTILNDTLYVGASWVTEESIDYLGPGAVIALNSTITQVPLPSTPYSALVVPLVAAISITAASAGLLVYLKKRKRHAAAIVED